MASPLSSITNELQLLHFLIDEPERVVAIRENYFLSTDGHDLYDVLYDLYQHGVKPTKDNIVGAGNCVNDKITPELIDTILSTQYDPLAFDHYKFLLQEAYSQDRIQSYILRECSKTVTTKGRLDIERMETLVSDLQDCISLAKSSEEELKFTDTLFTSYEKTVEQRVEGEKFYTTGCSKLDAVLPTGFAPKEMTTIFGSTGVGKSTFKMYLKNRLVNRDVPCLDITLEMSETSEMDRWMASRLRIPMSYLVGKPNEPVDESVLQMIRNEKSKLLKRKKYAMLDTSKLSIPELEKVIVQFKLKSQSDYAVVFVDLATMLDEFGSGEAKDYEKAVNLLHPVAKRTNTHLVLVVQAVQKSLENHRPTTLQGINLFRPSLASIKNSSAIAERSRTVLSVFRAKYYATRFFPDDPQVDELEDVVEVQVLKSSNGAVGQRVQYLHDEGMFRLFAVAEDYIPKTIYNLNSFQRDGEDQEL